MGALRSNQLSTDGRQNCLWMLCEAEYIIGALLLMLFATTTSAQVMVEQVPPSGIFSCYSIPCHSATPQRPFADWKAWCIDFGVRNPADPDYRLDFINPPATFECRLHSRNGQVYWLGTFAPYPGPAGCPAANPPYTYNPNHGMCERTVPDACTLSHASGSPCVCDTGYEWDEGHTQCVPQKTYTLTLQSNKPSIEPSGTTAGDDNSSATFTVTVIDQTTQQGPTQPVQVKLIAHKPTEGGHDHDDPSRPRGGLNGTECTTDDPCATLTFDGGIATQTVNYKAPIVSGKHSFSATCEKCGNSPQTANLEVKVQGLEPIPSSQFYIFAPSSKHGTKNHYLTPAAAEKLLLLAINYQSQIQFKVMDPNTNTIVWPEPFRVNDASLELGGLFDIYGDWTNPHKEHRRGVSVDLRANEGTPNTIPPENFYEFGELLGKVIPKGKVNKYILECTGDEEDGPQHNRVSENNCVSVLDGSFDNNRHYHIRLMGVK